MSQRLSNWYAFFPLNIVFAADQAKPLGGSKLRGIFNAAAAEHEPYSCAAAFDLFTETYIKDLPIMYTLLYNINSRCYMIRIGL